MAKYIPGRNYIGSSEIATDLDVTGPATFADTVTFSGNIISNVKISDSEGPYLNLYRDDNIIRSGNHLGSIVFGGGPEAYQESPLADSAIVLKAEAADDAASNNAPSKLTIQGVNDSSAALSDWVVLDGDSAKISFYQAIEVGVDDTGHDVKFFGATSGRYMQWNESDDKLKISDGAELVFGNADDLKIYHDGSNSYIKQQNARTGSLYIDQDTNDADIVFRNDDGSGGRTEYLRFDGGDVKTYVSKDMKFNDSVYATFGNNDLTIGHDSTNSRIYNYTGNLQITNLADDADIVFQCDDGSGGLATYFRLDGSQASSNYYYTLFPDKSSVVFGDSNDLRIYHDSTDSSIENETGNLYIQQKADDKDIIFRCDDGSGSVTAYLTLDGGSGYTKATKDIRFDDNISARFGTGSDFTIKHDGTDSTINNAVGDLIIKNSTDDKDIKFQCDDGSGGVTPYLTLDGSVTNIKVYKDIVFADNIDAHFGTGGDLRIYHDGTDSRFQEFTGNLNIINYADNKDIVFQSDDGAGGIATYFTIDGSKATHNGSATTSLYTVFPDLSRLAFGNDSDLNIRHDGTDSAIENTAGNLYIQNQADDKDIIFTCDDGSGGSTAYITLDGSAEKTVFTKDVRFNDSIDLNLGNINDFILRHDGSNSWIINQQVGDLYIRQNVDDKDIIFQSDDGSGGTETYFFLDGSIGLTTFPDNKKLAFGSGNDLQIKHSGSGGFITNVLGDLTISTSSDDGDIKFLSDDGSGGTTEYLRLDGGDLSVNILTQKLVIANLPTSNPGVDGQIWNNSGVLNVSSG